MKAAISRGTLPSAPFSPLRTQTKTAISRNFCDHESRTACRSISRRAWLNPCRERGSMPTPPANDVTQLLLDWSKGDQAALAQLMPVVYQELRKLAGSYLRGERPDHTLQPTALIHEAYLRLIDQ